MARKTYINLAGEAFVAELQDGSVYSRNGIEQGLLFVIQNRKGETIGCLSAFISMTTKAVWNNQVNLTPEIIKNLFLRILPHVPFMVSISDFSSIYPECIQLFIYPSDTRYDEKHKAQFVRSQENPQELVNQLVFDGEIDDDKVQKDILTYLYDVHMEDPMTFSNSGVLAKALFLEEKTVFRCLKYLSDDGFVEVKALVDAGGYAFSKITTPGVRYVRSNFKHIQAGTEVIVMGDFVGNDKITNMIQGNNNQNAVKSTVTDAFNITLVNQKVDALKEVIEKEYTEKDKEELVGQVEEIKNLATEKKNFPKIRAVIGGILTRTSEFAQIATLGIELYKLFTLKS